MSQLPNPKGIIQKSGYKLTATPTKAERERMDRIARMGCILSYFKSGQWGTPGAVHHMLTGRVPGRRAPHSRTICLAPRYHQYSPEALHDLGLERFAEVHGITEEELFEMTNEFIKQYA